MLPCSFLICLLEEEYVNIGIGCKTRPHRKYRYRGRVRSQAMIYDRRNSGYYENPNGAKIIKSSHFDYDFELGHKIALICVAKGNPLPRITWFKDGIELYNHPYLQISEWRIGKDKIKVKMEITPARQMDIGAYACQADNKFKVDRKRFVADYTTGKFFFFLYIHM
ncbi:Immunoglobulin domain-containing protein oig-4 [Nymphon striatum]|nr:Immunoglobulin domain-containing protein oig-4 [Nymphon striatum]